MKAYAPSPAVETQRSVAARSGGVGHTAGEPGFVDNRPETIAQRKLAGAISSGTHVAAQRQRLRGMFGGAVQFKGGPEDDELIQGMFAPVQSEVARNDTGLPDGLKSGVESLSGMSLDGVKVHYNSPQPAQLNALAYAQGSDIHVAPGQEQHLPHEAWHVVQQAQGRVKPTMQLRGVEIDDNEHLESEADRFGRQAVQTMPAKSPTLRRSNFARAIVQRVGGVKSGYNPDTIAKVTFKAAVKELFDLARLLNKARKQIATKSNAAALGRVAEPDKGKQVKGAYASDLIAINLDPAWLSKVLTDDVAIDAILKNPLAATVIEPVGADVIEAQIKALKKKVSVKLDSQEILDQTWKEADGGARPTAKILTGDGLYVLKTAKNVEGGVFRDVYKKLGKADGEHNEYVLDDFGKRTRRFAYMEKGYHQWMAFKEKGFLTGKTQNFIGDATGKDSSKVDPTDFENQHLTEDEKELVDELVTGKDTAENRKLALAYIHQWKGSGPGQRGLSLASTDKDNAVFGNAGEPFKTAEGAKFKIDLAKTNPADNVLINHYSTESATRSKLPATGGATSDRKLGGHYQYERSAIKNREVYLQHLRPEAVVSITPNAGGVDIARDSAIFNAQKQAAISSSAAEKNVTEWQTRKTNLEQDLVQARATKVAAPRAVATARQNILRYEGERQKYNPRYLKATWRPDLKRKMTDYDYWDYFVRSWTSEEERQAQSLVQANQAIAALPAKILECETKIAEFRLLIKAKPDGSNEHATKGWATGELYTQGYEAGLLKVKGKTLTNKQAIADIFKAAYKDGAGKAEAKRTGKAYTEKYDAYWEGYGKALKTALVA